jgi:predicted MPP superfamily phosphohydrolase
MKIVVIGDLHGKGVWLDIVKKESADKYVFVGDYFDSFDISFEYQNINFKDLIKFKEQNEDKVVLLIGNHDYHYMKNIHERYSGYQNIYRDVIEVMLDDAFNKNYLSICYKYNDFIFTHAGITKTWYETFIKKDGVDLDKIEIELNDYLKYKPNVYNFNIGKNNSYYGDDITQSPLWVRPNSLLKDGIDGIKQVVGHTAINGIRIEKNLILVDCFDYKNEYLVIDGGEVTIKELK